MAGSVKTKPDQYHNVTPYLMIKGAAKALEFYKKVFGATEVMRIGDPGGNQIGHAEIRIGDSIVMLADEYPDMEALSPESIGGSPVGLHLYVDDVDAVFSQALANGARERQPVEDKFYGDRSGSITDPFGHIWHIATHKEDLSPEELKRRAAEAFAGAK